FTGYHAFFVRAVDNQGGMSAWEGRYFNTYTVAPTSAFLFPVATTIRQGILRSAPVGPTMVCSWQGSDIDAPDPRPPPVRHHLYCRDVTPLPEPAGAVDIDAAIRQTLALPGTFVSGDTTRASFNLTVGHTYCLVVKAIDEAGVEEPLPTTLEDLPGRNSYR